MIMMRIYVGLCKKEQVNCVMKIILFVHLFVRWKWSVCGILFEHKVILLMWIKDSTRDPKKQLNSVCLFPFTTSAQFFLPWDRDKWNLCYVCNMGIYVWYNLNSLTDWIRDIIGETRFLFPTRRPGLWPLLLYFASVQDVHTPAFLFPLELFVCFSF